MRHVFTETVANSQCLIDVARIFSKEVEHSEGNAQDLKEMCMMEEIAKVDALCRQI